VVERHVLGRSRDAGRPRRWADERGRIAPDDLTALAFFRRRFRAAGTPARAASEKAYLKSSLRFYGTSVPEIRRAAKDFAREHPELDRKALRAIAEACYDTDEHELRSGAIALLDRLSKTLDDRDLPWLVGLVRRSDTWAHVDWLAVAVIGDVVGRDARSPRRLPGWAADRSFWVRRTALLAQHDQLKAGGGDFPLFARLAEAMLDEREFFIRKAIGWVLREVSKRRPELSYAFLHEHADRVSRLTLQEGAKYLPPAQRSALGLAAEAAWIRREQVRRGAGPPVGSVAGPELE